MFTRNRNQSIVLLVLGVLLPFWTVGEFAHLDWCGEQCSINSTDSSSCKTCSQHSHPPSDSDSDQVGQEHNCLICDFFDQLNVDTPVVSDLSFVESQIAIFDFEVTTIVVHSLVPTARGPPIV